MNAPKMTDRTIQMNNKSGTFSCRAQYTDLDNGTCEVAEWTWDSLGILPNGAEVSIMPLAQAQAQYRERKANGWK
jgi:hypothetical protein